MLCKLKYQILKEVGSVLFFIAYSVIPIALVYYLFALIIKLRYLYIQNNFLLPDSFFLVHSDINSYSRYEPGFANIRKILWAKSVWTWLYVAIGLLVNNFLIGNLVIKIFVFIQFLGVYAEWRIYKRTKTDSHEEFMADKDLCDYRQFMIIYRYPFVFQCIQAIITIPLIYWYDMISDIIR